MARITWSPALSVGVPQLDEQHRRLVDILNRLHDAIQDGRARERFDGVLAELVDYGVYHFRAEEQYLAGLGDSGAVSHRREHDRFAETLLSIKSAYGPSAPLATLQTLSDWLLEHITTTDRLDAPFAADRRAA
jgi:hemerythrin